jgi:hypothetical protein
MNNDNYDNQIIMNYLSNKMDRIIVLKYFLNAVRHFCIYGSLFDSKLLIDSI